MNHNVFLLSGGTRVAVHLGAVRAIEESGREIAAWAGASGGSLVAAVLASGYSHDDAVALMMDTDYRKFLDVRPLGWFRGYGLCSGQAFENWLDQVLGGMQFRHLDVPLSVVATDVATGAPFVFSYSATPEERIATAVRCSIGIPGVFAVRRVNDRTLVDGSLAPVQPAELFPDADHPSIVVRMVADAARRKLLPQRFGLTSYIRRVAELVLSHADDIGRKDLWTHDVCIDAGEHSPIDFGIAASARSDLYDLGYGQSRVCLTTADRGGAATLPSPATRWIQREAELESVLVNVLPHESVAEPPVLHRTQGVVQPVLC